MGELDTEKHSIDAIDAFKKKRCHGYEEPDALEDRRKCTVVVTGWKHGETGTS
jgi:hypothetical protein